MRFLAVLAVLGTVALAQTSATTQTSGQAQTSTTTPAADAYGQAASTGQAGIVVPAVLSKSVDSKKAKVGDEVAARTMADIRSTSGQVLIPRDSKLLGKVTQATARSKGDGTSSLGIAFDRAVLKNGTTLNLTSTIQALIAAPPPPPPSESGPSGDTSMGSSSGPRSGAGGGGYSGGGPAGGAVGAVGNTAGGAIGSVGGVAGSTVGTATPIGGSESSITTQTTGVVGMGNLQLNSGNSTSGSLVTGNDKSVKLDSNTRVLVSVTAASPAPASEQSSKKK